MDGQAVKNRNISTDFSKSVEFFAFFREISRREGVSGAFSGDLSTEFSKSVDGFSKDHP